MPLQQGSIVWATIADEHGRNHKSRRTILVTPTQEFDASDEVVVVAITSTFDKPLPENRIELPWARHGHPVTGLTKPSVAVCDWLVRLPKAQIATTGHRCPAPLLRAVLERVR